MKEKDKISPPHPKKRKEKYRCQNKIKKEDKKKERKKKR